jgi:hypothetical protein
MSGAGIINILNKSVSFIDDDKCYLEVGTHRGCTLLGAALNNKQMCYGVDNFAGHNSSAECAPFQTIEEGLNDAISKLSSGNVKYFKQGYVEFFENRVDVEGKKVEVYLYDGDHSLDNTYRGIVLAIPTLADDAIVFLDDSANNDRPAVWGAINLLLEDDKRFSLVKEWTPTKEEMHKTMWCGFVALRFKRN